MKIPILLAAMAACAWTLNAGAEAHAQEPDRGARADEAPDRQRSTQANRRPNTGRRDGDRRNSNRDPESRRGRRDNESRGDGSRGDRDDARERRTPRERDTRRPEGRRENDRGDRRRRRDDDSRRGRNRRGDDDNQWFDPDWWYENPNRPDRGRRDRDRDDDQWFDPDWWYEYPGDRDRGRRRWRRDWDREWRRRSWRFDRWDRRDLQGRRAVLGVGVNDRPGRGVTVSRVVARSPADQAGLRPGDRIVSVDREAVFDRRDLSQILSRHDPGDHVRIHVRRDGRRMRLTAELDPRSELY